MKWRFANPSEFADRSGDSLPLRAPREWSNADRSSGDAILKRSILFLRRRAATSNPVLRMADGPRGPGNPGDAGIKGCGLHINLATTADVSGGHPPGGTEWGPANTRTKHGVRGVTPEPNPPTIPCSSTATASKRS